MTLGKDGWPADENIGNDIKPEMSFSFSKDLCTAGKLMAQIRVCPHGDGPWAVLRKMIGGREFQIGPYFPCLAFFICSGIISEIENFGNFAILGR